MSQREEPKWEMPPVFHRFYVLTGWLLDRVEKFPTVWRGGNAARGAVVARHGVARGNAARRAALQ